LRVKSIPNFRKLVSTPIISEIYIRVSRYSERAVRYALWLPAFCTRYTVFHDKQSEERSLLPLHDDCTIARSSNFLSVMTGGRK